jgi:hypothetical protein
LCAKHGFNATYESDEEKDKRIQNGDRYRDYTHTHTHTHTHTRARKNKQTDHSPGVTAIL